ncbi:hypothetical protein [Sphingomonas sp. LR60]|uniref:hypothetical protein n=1 Tax=Sphingomonas sp. LR60 TaxID=3050233 RepID=UPI003FA69030
MAHYLLARLMNLRQCLQRGTALRLRFERQADVPLECVRVLANVPPCPPHQLSRGRVQHHALAQERVGDRRQVTSCDGRRHLSQHLADLTRIALDLATPDRLAGHVVREETVTQEWFDTKLSKRLSRLLAVRHHHLNCVVILGHRAPPKSFGCAAVCSTPFCATSAAPPHPTP